MLIRHLSSSSVRSFAHSLICSFVYLSIVYLLLLFLPLCAHLFTLFTFFYFIFLLHFFYFILFFFFFYPPWRPSHKYIPQAACRIQMYIKKKTSIRSTPSAWILPLRAWHENKRINKTQYIVTLQVFYFTYTIQVIEALTILCILGEINEKTIPFHRFTCKRPFSVL